MTKDKLRDVLRKQGIFATLDDPLLETGMVFNALLTEALASFGEADKAAAERIRLACISGLDEARKIGVRQAQIAIDQAATRIRSAGADITAQMVAGFQDERRKSERFAKFAVYAAMASFAMAMASLAGLVGVLLV